MECKICEYVNVHYLKLTKLPVNYCPTKVYKVYVTQLKTWVAE